MKRLARMARGGSQPLHMRDRSPLTPISTTQVSHRACVECNAFAFDSVGVVPLVRARCLSIDLRQNLDPWSNTGSSTSTSTSCVLL